MSESINSVIGLQLKRARTDKGWSLDITREHTGVSKAMLGQIERGESSPTIAKLWMIANGFNLPLSYFLREIANKDSPQQVLNSEDSLIVSSLFPFDESTKMEVLSLTLSPQHQHMSLPHNKGVIEHIIVVEGEMEYFLDNQWHTLSQGEVIKFNANKTHGYRNLSQKNVTFHNIINYINH